MEYTDLDARRTRHEADKAREAKHKCKQRKLQSMVLALERGFAIARGEGDYDDKEN